MPLVIPLLRPPFLLMSRRENRSSFNRRWYGHVETAAAHIFERFWRADTARIESNGVLDGLSIAKMDGRYHDIY